MNYDVNSEQSRRENEKHRLECHAREVMKWNKERRQEHYEGIRSRHGQKSLDYLIAEVKKQYKLRERAAEVSL